VAKGDARSACRRSSRSVSLPHKPVCTPHRRLRLRGAVAVQYTRVEGQVGCVPERSSALAEVKPGGSCEEEEAAPQEDAAVEWVRPSAFRSHADPVVNPLAAPAPLAAPRPPLPLAPSLSRASPSSASLPAAAPCSPATGAATGTAGPLAAGRGAKNLDTGCWLPADWRRGGIRRPLRIAGQRFCHCGQRLDNVRLFRATPSAAQCDT
jgi:hypothetical protein